MKAYKNGQKSKFVYCKECNRRLIRRYITDIKTNYYTPFDWYCYHCNITILDSEVEVVDVISKAITEKFNIEKERKEKLKEHKRS